MLPPPPGLAAAALPALEPLAAGIVENPAAFGMLVAAALLFLGGLVLDLAVRRPRRRAAADPAGPPLDAAAVELDDLHTELTGVPASNPALGRNPVTGTVHIRRRHTPRAHDTAHDDSPVPRAFAVPADTQHSDPPRVPDLVPGANSPAGPVPAAADARDPYDLLTDAVGDPDRLTALAHAHPPLAYTAHLLAAAAGGPQRTAHLYAAAELPATTADDDPRAEELRSDTTLPVVLADHHALARVPCDRSGLAVAVAVADLTSGDLTDARETALTLDNLTGTRLTRLLVTATDPDPDPAFAVLVADADPAATDTWDVLDAHQQLLAAHHTDAPEAVVAACADLTEGLLTHAADVPDLTVDRDALAVDITYLRAHAAWLDGDPRTARALVERVLTQQPQHPRGRQLIRRLDQVR